MASISFKIRPRKGSIASIYLIFSYGRGNELRYATGWQVENINNWNEEKQQIKNVVAESYAISINQKIKKLELFFQNKYQELLSSNIEIKNNVLKNELDIYLNKKKPVSSPTAYKNLLDCYEWYYNHYSKNPLPTTKKPLAIGTIKSYKTSFLILKEFNDTVYAINYDRITLNFYSEFLIFLKNKGFSNNYISNHIKMLKTIMNYAWEHKFHKNLDFKTKAFTKISEDVFNIYLTTEELDRINRLDLTGRTENAKDLFVIGAYTGLRVSDFNRLTEDNIKSHSSTKYIEIIAKKTNKTVVIPINSIVQKILNKREGKPPKTMPEQNINKLLKKIGEKAGIDEIVRIEKTIGGEKTKTDEKKYNLITNHTARRSFCTNAYKSGMPTLDIMTISGHKSEKTFYKYIKITDLERLNKISKHPFFQ